MSDRDSEPQATDEVRHSGGDPAPEASPGPHGGAWASSIEHLTARDLMTPGVVTIAADASLGAGMRAMAAHDVHAILVVDGRTGKGLGWATDRGLLAHIERDMPLTPISEAVTEGIITVAPGTGAAEAAATLAQAGTSHLLVAFGEGSFPEGVISALDLVCAVGRG